MAKFYLTVDYIDGDSITHRAGTELHMSDEHPTFIPSESMQPLDEGALEMKRTARSRKEQLKAQAAATANAPRELKIFVKPQKAFLEEEEFDERMTLKEAVSGQRKKVTVPKPDEDLGDQVEEPESTPEPAKKGKKAAKS
jgi:hypothetical protein